MIEKIFFIIGAFRSGTTAVARILNLASNANVYVEQPPKLSRETRDLYDGRLPNPGEIVKVAKQPSINEDLSKGLIYGDKSANYLPFIPYLNKIWGCQFVFVVRDGRNVVRSMIDWQQVINSKLYRRNEDSDGFPYKSVEDDYWDYSLIRPKVDDPYFDIWKKMEVFEKFCWYWQEYNEIMYAAISMLPINKYKIILIDRCTAGTIRDLYSFLSMEGFDGNRVEELLAAKINTTRQRGIAKDPFPPWIHWSTLRQECFADIAGNMMRKLGYWE